VNRLDVVLPNHKRPAVFLMGKATPRVERFTAEGAEGTDGSTS
jgi:hypothetical protein